MEVSKVAEKVAGLIDNNPPLQVSCLAVKTTVGSATDEVTNQSPEHYNHTARLMGLAEPNGKLYIASPGTSGNAHMTNVDDTAKVSELVDNSYTEELELNALLDIFNTDSLDLEDQVDSDEGSPSIKTQKKSEEKVNQVPDKVVDKASKKAEEKTNQKSDEIIDLLSTEKTTDKTSEPPQWYTTRQDPTV